MPKNVLRVCLERNGVSYALFGADGSLKERGFWEGVEELGIEGYTVISLQPVDLGRKCIYVYIDDLRVERRGALVIIRGSASRRELGK